jgi:hypothetical protein
MNIALCKCGIDMSEHDEYGHAFDASGTKYRCEELIKVYGGGGVYLCPRPAYHLDEGVDHGPLTGEKLW